MCAPFLDGVDKVFVLHVIFACFHTMLSFAHFLFCVDSECLPACLGESFFCGIERNHQIDARRLLGEAILPGTVLTFARSRSPRLYSW